MAPDHLFIALKPECVVVYASNICDKINTAYVF